MCICVNFLVLFEVLFLLMSGYIYLMISFNVWSCILQRLGKRFVIGPTQNLSISDLEERKKKHIKFKESGWKCIYYLSGEILALAVTYNEPWFTDTSKFWVGPGDQIWPEQSIK